MIPSARELMHIRNIAHGNEKAIVEQLLIRQVKKELVDAVDSGITGKHPFLREINQKIARDAQKKKYPDFSPNQSFMASSLSFAKGSRIKGLQQDQELLDLQREFATLEVNIKQGLFNAKENLKDLILCYVRAQLAKSSSIAFEIAILIKLKRGITNWPRIAEICTPDRFPTENSPNWAHLTSTIRFLRKKLSGPSVNYAKRDCGRD